MSKAGFEPALSRLSTGSLCRWGTWTLLVAGDGNRTHFVFRPEVMSLVSARCLFPHKLEADGFT